MEKIPLMRRRWNEGERAMGGGGREWPEKSFKNPPLIPKRPEGDF
jgi:hypothetical protein